MKEFVDLYKLVWGTYGGSKAFFNGQLFGVALGLFGGVLSPLAVLAIWSLFIVFYAASQIHIALKAVPDGVDAKMFEQGRMTLMVKTSLSVYLFTGFSAAMVILYYLMAYLGMLPQTS